MIAIDGDVALHQIEEAVFRLGQLARILPQQIARDGIQRLHVIARAVHENDAIVDQRRGFVGARGSDQLQAERSWPTFDLLICLSGLKPWSS